jgi:glycosyltransferase involved in cell wall biosynthesis
MDTTVPDYMKGLQSLLTLPITSQESISNMVMKEIVKEEPVSINKKFKFMLISTHCHQVTGYSKVCWGLIRQLAKLDWLDVVHYGFQKFSHIKVPADYRPYPSNIKVIDACAEEKPFEHGFGFKQLPDFLRKEKPDVIMIYNDLSVIAKFLMEIEKSGIPQKFKTWLYVDQVYNMQPRGLIEMMNAKAERIFAFSNHWKKCLKDQEVNRPIDVILHGFENDVYKTIPRDEIRKKLNIPQQAFIYLNLNRNQPRKRYDLLIMAFVELIVKYPTKPIVLMCICDKGEKGGWWLFELYQRELKKREVPLEQFASRLMISTQEMSFTDEQINDFYNAADVGVNTADGEGWGLCNFEQMGVGIPQVVSNVGGFKEFCKPNNSMAVEPKHRYYLPMVYSPVGGEAEAVDPHDFCLAMEEYLLDSEKRKAHGEAAKACVQTYTWERCCEPLIRRLRQEKEDKEVETSE